MNSKLINWSLLIIGFILFFIFSGSPQNAVAAIGAMTAGVGMGNMIINRFPFTGKLRDWILPMVLMIIAYSVVLLIPFSGLVIGSLIYRLITTPAFILGMTPGWIIFRFWFCTPINDL